MAAREIHQYTDQQLAREAARADAWTFGANAHLDADDFEAQVRYFAEVLVEVRRRETIRRAQRLAS
jgi:hypothetical protein